MSKPTTSGNGQIQRASAGTDDGGSLVKFISDHAADFAQVLPKHLTAERMTRLAISVVRRTQGMEKVTIASFAQCIMACSTLGLEPNTPLGHAYLIPRWNGRTKTQECTLIIGYKGLIDLMYRSAFVSSVKADPVFEPDFFQYEKGLQPILKHRPSGEENPEKLTHVYTIVRWREGGEPIWDVLNRDQILKRRDRGGYDPNKMSPWKTDFVAMAQKTGVRTIARWAPTSTERPQLQAAVAYEDAAERGQLSQAISSLGEVAQEGLHKMGVEPEEDRVIDAEYAEVGEEREPGSDG